ncbi:peptidoglycan recognition protein [Streptomyces griseus]|uniref:peptidoglycan recognition protein family protein n=1 Tax=Streptomyces griseus TaxID=1911 RepID=UPI00055FD583|nr:peptidoglycan recognition protein [Streptomyces griseus]
MHGLLASSIGVTCAAALALPPAPHPGHPAHLGRPGLPDLPGSTQSLPLAPLSRARGPAADQGLPRRDVRHFSLVGVIWDDPATELHGSVQVRTRAAGTGTWSGWQDVETHNADHGADPDTAEGTSGRVRGATTPLWVGDSDGVEVRVHADDDTDRSAGTRAPRAVTSAAPLPSGLRLELVDPGADDPAERAGAAPPRHVPVHAPRTGPLRNPDDQTALSTEAAAASATNTDLLRVPLGATDIPALSPQETEEELSSLGEGELTEQQRAKPYIGPRPHIVTRRGWGADESLRERTFVYTKKVKAAFVHHTASGNAYTCSQSPSLIRGIYRYHVRSMGWRDIGYNFVVDKCGTIYEGRAGGVAKPVLGAHTLGFNTNSMGIAVLGTFGSSKPSSSAVKGIARLTAWKLGLFGANPNGKTYLKSGGGNLYAKGRNVRLHVISGHRDGFATECPGRKLYGKLGSARSTAARYQGR